MGDREQERGSEEETEHPPPGLPRDSQSSIRALRRRWDKGEDGQEMEAARPLLVTRVLQHGVGSLAAQHVLRRRAATCDADGAEDGDAVEHYETAGRGQHAP